MSITDHGYMQLSASLMRTAYAKVTGGDMYSYWIYYYGLLKQPNTRTNIFSLNHDADTIIGEIEGPLGRPYVNFQHPADNLIYIGTFCSYTIPGKLGSFNFLTGVYTDLADVPGPSGDGNQDGCQAATYSDEANKRIFATTNTRGRLWAYDPVTTAVEDFGVLDDPGGVYTSYLRYGMSVQVDTTHAYVAFKDVSPVGAIYLIRVTLSDQTNLAVWKTDGLSFVGAYRGTDGNIYIGTAASGSTPTTWYGIGDFVNPIAAPADYYPIQTRAASISYTGYGYNPYLAYPDGSGGKTVPFYYKRPGDADDARLLTADLVTVSDFSTWRAAGDLDGNLISFGDGYSPTTRLNTLTGAKSQVGVFPGLSGYSIGQDRIRRKLYCCGYPHGQDWEYDPAAAWALGTNPKQLILATGGVADARYTYAVHQGSDGNMWFGFDWVRSLSTHESDVGYYNPDTEDTGLISATVPGLGGGANLNTYTMENLARDRSGSKLVFSGYTATDSLLAVIPVWKKGVNKYIRPIVGGASQGRIVNVGTSKATTNHFVGITVGASYQIYCVDIGTGALVWGPFTKAGTSSFLAGSGPVFAHGWVWYFVGNDIYQLDPTDVTGTPVKALDGAANGLVAGGLYWPLPNSGGAEDSVFHWENAGNTHIYEIPKADLGV